jgi:hypothetical protein
MRTQPDQIVQLRIALSHIEPTIWRRVRVPANLTLRRLHDVIQAVFDWWDYHLHQFEVGEKVYGQPEVEVLAELTGQRIHSDRNVRLGALVDRGVERFIYRYDFGDDWEHIITVEEVREPEPGVEYPILVEGARAAPPEDCGGPPGFIAFCEAMADETHEQHDDLLDWYGQPFDPDDMNLDAVEAMLSRIRASRRRGPAKGSPGNRRGSQ